VAPFGVADLAVCGGSHDLGLADALPGLAVADLPDQPVYPESRTRRPARQRTPRRASTGSTRSDTSPRRSRQALRSWIRRPVAGLRVGVTGSIPVSLACRVTSAPCGGKRHCNPCPRQVRILPGARIRIGVSRPGARRAGPGRAACRAITECHRRQRRVNIRALTGIRDNP
jgi:hypothetical protein